MVQSSHNVFDERKAKQLLSDHEVLEQCQIQVTARPLGRGCLGGFLTILLAAPIFRVLLGAMSSPLPAILCGLLVAVLFFLGVRRQAKVRLAEAERVLEKRVSEIVPPHVQADMEGKSCLRDKQVVSWLVRLGGEGILDVEWIDLAHKLGEHGDYTVLPLLMERRYALTPAGGLLGDDWYAAEDAKRRQQAVDATCQKAIQGIAARTPNEVLNALQDHFHPGIREWARKTLLVKKTEKSRKGTRQFPAR